MAYTNSVETGSTPLEAGTTFTRGLMWAGISLVAFMVATAFDYRWLKTLAWPIYAFQLGLLVLTLAIGDGVGGSARWIAIGPLTFQFSELAKVLMIIVLARYLTANQHRLDRLSTILGACLLVVPPLGLIMLQPDLGTSLVFAGDPGRDALDVGREPEVAARAGGRGAGDRPDRVDLRPARLPEGPADRVPVPGQGHLRAPATSSTSRRSRSARAA